MKLTFLLVAVLFAQGCQDRIAQHQSEAREDKYLRVIDAKGKELIASGRATKGKHFGAAPEQGGEKR